MKMRLAILLLAMMVGCGGDCPSDQPSGTCEQAATCSYGDQRCECTGNEWQCVPSVCPDELDPSGQACTAEGTSCHYGFEWSCSCKQGKWVCIGGVVPDLAMPRID